MHASRSRTAVIRLGTLTALAAVIVAVGGAGAPRSGAAPHQHEGPLRVVVSSQGMTVALPGGVELTAAIPAVGVVAVTAAANGTEVSFPVAGEAELTSAGAFPVSLRGQKPLSVPSGSAALVAFPRGGQLSVPRSSVAVSVRGNAATVRLASPTRRNVPLP